ncbi:hypothetical protein Salat_1752300 [Sesamum alatum]|uniref:Uncharacterized protein n=1 Tax=Sesamum alatum TaxID=300844 RepID=A0AAE2CKK3_9LAMI|nr:hypothetical protein Salat_1752300 [Sesamum alatum]
MRLRTEAEKKEGQVEFSAAWMSTEAKGRGQKKLQARQAARESEEAKRPSPKEAARALADEMPRAPPLVSCGAETLEGKPSSAAETTLSSAASGGGRADEIGSTDPNLANQANLRFCNFAMEEVSNSSMTLLAIEKSLTMLRP